MSDTDETQNEASPSDGSEQRIDAIVEEFVVKLQRGETVDAAEIVAAHPDLAPILGRRLAFALHVFLAARQSSQDDGENATQETQSLRPAQALYEFAFRVNCPHCGTKIQIVDPLSAEATCRTCGSTIRLDSHRKTSHAPNDYPRTIGRFELLEVVGRGAFGIVYKARDTELKRTVAVKIPRLGYFVSQEDEQRFVREARHAARLRHASIVPVYEVGRQGDMPYIVSELIDGRTLSDLISHRRLDFRETAELIATIADALDYAHNEKVIHRDIKPSNILLDQNLRPYITDFGLARAEEGEFTITLDGQVLGTLSYMPPEQAGGTQNPMDRRSDVYSLGVILYRMLSGELPFRGGRRLVLHQVLHDEPRPPRAVNEFVPRDLQVIALKAMMKDSRRRYQTAQAMAEDLRHWLKGEPIRARSVSRTERVWRWCRRKPLVAGLLATVAMLLAIGGVGGGAWGWRESQLRGEVQQAFVAVSAQKSRADEESRISRRRLSRQYTTSGVQLMHRGDYFRSLPWLTAGWSLEADDPGREQIHRRRLGTLLWHCPRLISLKSGDAPVRHATFSPDGRLAASGFEDGTVLVWEIETGRTLATMHHRAATRHLVFSPDGKRLATASNDRTAQVWDVATGSRVSPPLTHDNLVNQIAFSPDGRQVLTASNDDTAAIWDASSGDRATQFRHPNDVRWSQFTPDGQRVVGICWQNVAEECEVHVWNVQEPTASKLVFKHKEMVHHATIRGDGKRLLTASRDKTARVWNLEKSGDDSIPFRHESEVVSAFFVDDGIRVVTVTIDGGVRRWDVATGQLQGDPLETGETVRAATLCRGQLLGIAGRDRSATIWNISPFDTLCPPLPHLNHVDGIELSADGRRVLTYGDDGLVKIWDLAVGYLSAPRMTHSRKINRTRISPSGKLAVTCGQDSVAALWSLPLGNPFGERITHPDEVLDAEFSPDESLLATACADSSVRLFQVSTGKPVGIPWQHGKYVLHVRFAPDGRSLFAADGDGKVRVWDVASGTRRFEVSHDNRIVWLEISRDGKRLATASREGTARVWDAATGQPISPPLRHADQSPVLRCSFSPDRRHIITASQDGTALVWEADTGKRTAGPLRHQGSVLDAAFSPDGGTVLTAGVDGQVVLWTNDPEPKRRVVLETFGSAISSSKFSREGNLLFTLSLSPVSRISTHVRATSAAQLWDAATGDLMSPLLRHRDPISNARLSPDNSIALTADSLGVARIWSLPRDERPLDSLGNLAMVLSGRRIDPTSGSVAIPGPELQSLWETLRHAKLPELLPSAISEGEWAKLVESPPAATQVNAAEKSETK